MTRTDTPIDPAERSAVFHEGETALQTRYGVRDRMETFASRIVRDHLTEEHRLFYAGLPYVALGAIDGDGWPWATLVTGKAGFMTSHDERSLRLDTQPVAGDPVGGALDLGARVAGLGIQFHDRRRNRFAARVAERDATGLTLSIDQTFGNCPQYILTRAPSRVATDTPHQAEHLAALDDAAIAMIRNADTVFVASAAPETADDPDGRHGADVSHRGGKPGFVRVNDDGSLTIPDFAGNLHFNTLGNLLLNPRAGLTVADWTTGDMLFLSGETEIDFDSREIAAFRGAERLWHLRPTRIVRIRAALSLRFEGGEASPNSLITGDWETAAARLAAEELGQRWRPWVITRTTPEASDIRSLTLEPADDAGQPVFTAGQFLPVRVTMADGTVETRTYTISSAPEDSSLRISVKRDGRVSERLHTLGPGDRIEARAPRGAFTMDTSVTRPAVLLSAGIGITPMLSMLRHAVFEGARTRTARPIWFLHQGRTIAERPFFDEIGTLAKRSDAIAALWSLSAPESAARPGEDYQVKGRLSVTTLKRLLPFDDYEFWLCGPAGFVQAMYDGLRDLSVPDARIHAESFGPSSLTRRPDAAEATSVPRAAEGAATVQFDKADKSAPWTPADGTLLDLAEAAGLEPPSGCRSGGCGSCAVRLLSGKTRTIRDTTAPVGPEEVLLCSSVPDATDGGPTVEIKLDL